MSTWWPARQRLAVLAILSASLTAAFVVRSAEAPWAGEGAVVYLMVSALAVFFPAAIAAQVIGGQLLLGALLLAPNGPGYLILVPAVATVIVTAELLAAVARMDTPTGGDPGDALPRTGVAALVGGGVFLAVGLLSALPGPRGLIALVVASGACVLAAFPLAATDSSNKE